MAQRLDPALAALPPLASDARQTLQSLQQAGASVSALAVDLGKTNQRLNADGGPIDQITAGTQSLARAADQFSTATLPRVNRAADDTARAARQMGRAAGASATTRSCSSMARGASRPGRVSQGLAAPRELDPLPRCIGGAGPL